MKALSKRASSINVRVAWKSAPVSPGKPTMTSAVRARSGTPPSPSPPASTFPPVQDSPALARALASWLDA